MVKLGTFSMTSYTLSHLFQSLFFIHITLRIFSLCKSLEVHILTFSYRLKSKKQTIFLVGAINNRFVILIRSILSGYPKKLNVWSIHLQCHNRRANKTRNFGNLYMYIYCAFLSNYRMNIQDMFPFLIISYLIQYVLSSKNSLNCFTTLFSSVCQGVFPEYYLALQFDCPMANFVPLLRTQPN